VTFPLPFRSNAAIIDCGSNNPFTVVSRTSFALFALSAAATTLALQHFLHAYAYCSSTSHLLYQEISSLLLSSADRFWPHTERCGSDILQSTQ
jgi:hypothetical protein